MYRPNRRNLEDLDGEQLVACCHYPLAGWRADRDVAVDMHVHAHELGHNMRYGGAEGLTLAWMRGTTGRCAGVQRILEPVRTAYGPAKLGRPRFPTYSPEMTDRDKPKKARASEEALRPAIKTARGVTQDLAQSGGGVQESLSVILNLEVSVRRTQGNRRRHQSERSWNVISGCDAGASIGVGAGQVTISL